MIKRFITPDLSDKRIKWASDYLEGAGFLKAEKAENADFVLLGVNPDRSFLSYDIPIIAGNVSGSNIFDYTKEEEFAVKNAYLTAEGALSLAISESGKSLINSSVLILGYGRIGKALHRYLNAFTARITVCARRSGAAALAEAAGAATVRFEDLKGNMNYDFIFNTVPHPVLGSGELYSVKGGALIIDLASFPGGVDVQLADYLKLRLITARSLPSRYSPASAGKVVGETAERIIKEVIL
ncbi:MAG: hypothetical protein K6C14_03495 [Eubacterium sp.]|nr:hypothetical protein [Eubacterium sp.]